MPENRGARVRVSPLVAAIAAGTTMLATSVAGRSEAAQVPVPEWGDTCSFGPILMGEFIGFARGVAFTLAIDANHGYVVDCYTGVDAYFEFQYEWDGRFVYSVWGQLGDLQ